MAEANVGWGAPRIHGELFKLVLSQNWIARNVSDARDLAVGRDRLYRGDLGA
jgi:hypothetical protein